MQIIFDTRRDTHADAVQLQAMLAAFLAYTPPRVETGGVPHKGQEASAVESPAPMLDVTTLNDSTAVPSTLFTPGDLGAPSPADAAPSPIVPEVPQDGVPMPPSVVSVPAPPSTAPVAPAVPSTSAPSGELDVNGLPWDERIHASSKTRNVDGSWRQRRNLSPVTLETVTAELRARAANPGNAALGDDAAKLAGLGMDPLSGQPLPTGGYVPAPPPISAGGTAANVPPPPVVATPPAPAAPDALTYDGFLAWVTPKMMDGSTPFDKVAAALSASGVSSLQELRDNPAAIPAVYAALGGV